nr:MAG TPA: hypothetical protein [Caudoviricetes sp.]
MESIIGTAYKKDSETATYIHLNDILLLVHHWCGETDDGFMDEWSIHRSLLSGKTDVIIIWYAYQRGYVDVASYKYPDGFDIQKLREIMKEAFNTIMPNDIKHRILEASLKVGKESDVFGDTNEELEDERKVLCQT